jgi:hypothetical protein
MEQIELRVSGGEHAHRIDVSIEHSARLFVGRDIDVAELHERSIDGLAEPAVEPCHKRRNFRCSIAIRTQASVKDGGLSTTDRPYLCQLFDWKRAVASRSKRLQLLQEVRADGLMSEEDARTNQVLTVLHATRLPYGPRREAHDSPYFPRMV